MKDYLYFRSSIKTEISTLSREEIIGIAEETGLETGNKRIENSRFADFFLRNRPEKERLETQQEKHSRLQQEIYDFCIKKIEEMIELQRLVPLDSLQKISFAD